MKLWQKVIVGFILGIIFGLFFPQYVTYVKPIGDIFLRLIKMIIAPLIFFSLLTGIISMGDSLGRIGKKAIFYYFSTTLLAIIFGITLALVLQPGKGVSLDLEPVSPQISSFDLSTFIINIVPDSAVGAFINGNILSTVFLAILVGIVLNKMGDIVSPVKELSAQLSKITLKIIGLIVDLSPYAVFAFMSWSIGTHGMIVIVSLLKLVGVIILGLICQYVILGILIYFLGNISPIPFYKKSLPYQIVAFSTASSKAALSTTMDVCRDRLGVSSSNTSFLLPLGACINMDGFSINLSITALFFAQALGVHLGWHDYLMLIFTVSLGSIGGAGFPGANLVILPIVLASIHLPIEIVGLVAGVDRILDMMRTTINITGDAAISLIVDNSEGMLNKEAYFS